MAKITGPQTTVVLWGGVDPGGEAGLAADLQAARALGAATRIVVTALTAQSAEAWQGASPVANDLRSHIVQHLDVPTSGLAIKSGMLSTRAHAKALAKFAQRYPSAPLVVDPLMTSSSGGSMWPREDLAALPAWLMRHLLPYARAVTPNWPELAWLVGRPLATRDDAEAALRLLPCPAVLKGGHAPGAMRGVDLVWSGQDIDVLQPSELWATSPRGTGCRMATALSIELARGRTLVDSTVAAKALVAQQAYPQGV